MRTSNTEPRAAENLTFSLSFDNEGDALFPPGEHAFLHSVFPPGEHLFPASAERLRELVRALEIDGQEVRIVPRAELLLLAQRCSESGEGSNPDPFWAPVPHPPFELRGLLGFLERHWPRVLRELGATLRANTERRIEARLEVLRESGAPQVIVDHASENRRRFRASPDLLASLDLRANVPNPYRQAIELLMLSDEPETVDEVYAGVGKLVLLAAQCCVEPLNPKALPTNEASAWMASPGWEELALPAPELDIAPGEVRLHFGDRYEELARLAFLEVQNARAPGGALLLVDAAPEEDEESEDEHDD